MHAELLSVLDPALVAVYHIGSTAVPGLAAKPIIDLMPLVTDLAALDAQQAKLEELGYQWHGEVGIDGRRYCTLSGESGVRLVQLHFFQTGSPQAERHLAFRDFLRTHPEITLEYEKEKRRARDLHPNDSHAYNDEKAAWVREVEARALSWSKNNFFSSRRVSIKHQVQTR